MLFGFLVFVLSACGLITDDDDDVFEITISFDTRGGDALDDMVISSDSTSITLPTPERDGYAFDGWYLDEDLSDPYVFTAILGETTVTLYAAWSEADMTYTVSFETGDGTIVEDVVVDDGETVSLPDDPTKADHVFGGWFVDSDLTEPFDDSSVITSDVTLYALWIEALTVEFYSDGALYDTVTVLEGDEVILPSEPSKEGHSFVAWYYENTFDTEFVSPYTVNESMSLYALFEVNEYTITFNSQGGSSVSDLVADYDETIIEPADPTRDGYDFTGWYLDEDLTDGFEFTTMPAEDLTLYAGWEAVGEIYEVGFVVDDALVHQTVVFEGDAIDFPSDPEKTGYTFVGWTLDGDLFDETTIIEDDLVFVAEFELNMYTVTYNSTGGTLVEDIDVYYGNPIPMPEAPTRTNYTFAGWYYDIDYTEPFIDGEMPAEDVILYARWIDEGDTKTLRDMILTQPDDWVTFDAMHVIFQSYLAYEDIHLTLITDGTASMFIVGDIAVSVGDIISFEGGLIYEGAVPIVGAVDQLSIDGFDDDIDYAYSEIETADLSSIDFNDPFRVGTFYRYTGFMMIEEAEGIIALFDPNVEDGFYPIINVMMSDDFDDDFALITSVYVRLGFTIMPVFEQGLHAVLYAEEVQVVEEIALSDDDQLDILEDLIMQLLDGMVVHPNDRLDVPPQDPFFGFEISATAVGENAMYYDADEDRFLWVDESTVIEFEITFGLNDTTRTVTVEIVNDPPVVSDVDSLHGNEMAVVDVVVLYHDNGLLIVADETGLLGLEAFDTSMYTVGERYLIEVDIAPRGPLVVGYVTRMIKERGVDNIDYSVLAIDEADLDNMVETYHAGSAARVEGILVEVEYGMYPFALLIGDTQIYISVRDADIYSMLEDALYEHVDITLYLYDYTYFSDEQYYVGYFNGDETQLNAEALSVDEMLDFVEAMIFSYEAPLRPQVMYAFPIEFEPYDITIEYQLDETDYAFIEVGSDSAKIGFYQEDDYGVTIIISHPSEDRIIETEFVVEDYDTSSIAYAKALPEGTEVMLEVTVTAVTADFYYIVTDGSGMVVINANLVPHLLAIGETFIFSGYLEESDHVTWLANPEIHVEKTEMIPSYPIPTEYTLEELMDLSLPLEEPEYIVVTGQLGHSGTYYQLISNDVEYAIRIGVDFNRNPDELQSFHGEEVRIEGYLMMNLAGELTIAYARQIEIHETGNIDSMYDAEVGTRYRVDAYAYYYYDGVFYFMDDSGVIPVFGVFEAWAKNREGNHFILYADITEENGAIGLTIEDSTLITTNLEGDYHAYKPEPIEITLEDYFALDFNTNEPYQYVYRITGMLESDEGSYYLGHNGEYMLLIDPEGNDPFSDDVGSMIEVDIILTRADDGLLTALYLP